MKKLFAILLIVSFIFTMTFVFASCGGTADTDTETETNITKPGETDTQVGSSNTDTGKDETTDDESDEEEDGIVYYVVNIEDQFGQPVEGVNLQICNDKFCLPSKITDAEGTAKYEFEAVESFKVQINEVPDDYIMPTDKIPFPEGKTIVTIKINRLEKYVITAVDMHDRPISGISVELLNGTDVVETVITEADGLASFTVEPGEYTARVKHSKGNTAFVLPTGESVTFENGKNVTIQFTISEKNIDYTIYAKNEEGNAYSNVKIKLYNKKLNLVAEAVTDQKGLATLQAPNGNYYAVVDSEDGLYAPAFEFSKNEEISAEVTVKTGAGTSSKTPIFLAGDLEIELDAGKELWYTIPDSNGKIIEINSETVSILYNGVPNDAKDGVLKLELRKNAVFKVITKITEGSEQISGKVYLPGSEETPFEINVNDLVGEYPINVRVSENGAVYYSFVANKNGTVRANSETENAYILINGNPNKKSVIEGDTVVICFTSKGEDGNSIGSAVDIEAKITFAETKANYSIEVLRENEILPNADVELYKYENGEYVLVKAVKCDVNGAYTFSELVETANYYIKAICGDDYETQGEYLAFGDETDLKVHINHKRDGSFEYPFLVNSEELISNTTTVELEAGKSVYYTIFFVPGVEISIDNKAAKLDIMIGGKTVETLSGEVLSYVLSGDADTNSRVLLLVSAPTEEGATVELTITAPELKAE